MTDKIKSPNHEDAMQSAADDKSEEQRQKIFDATFSKLMNEFGKACEEEGVEVAVAIAKHPKIDQPLVFYRATHIVEAAALMAGLLREIKADIFTSLNTDAQ